MGVHELLDFPSAIVGRVGQHLQDTHACLHHHLEERVCRKSPTSTRSLGCQASLAVEPGRGAEVGHPTASSMQQGGHMDEFHYRREG